MNRGDYKKVLPIWVTVIIVMGMIILFQYVAVVILTVISERIEMVSSNYSLIGSILSILAIYFAAVLYSNKFKAKKGAALTITSIVLLISIYNFIILGQQWYVLFVIFNTLIAYKIFKSYLIEESSIAVKI